MDMHIPFYLHKSYHTFVARFQGYSQGSHPEGGGSIRGGFMERGGYHGHRPYGRPYQPR